MFIVFCLVILIGAVVEVRFSKWTRRFLSIVPDFVMKGMQRAFGNRISRSMWSKHTDKNLIAEELRKISRINSIYAIKAFVCQMESPTASDWEPLKNSHLRTLLLVGDEDQATPLKDSTKLSEWLPNCEVFVVEKAGHMPMIEQPQIVNQKIEEFITRKN
jgi:3-oxoadipate enol-lactonase